MFVLVIFYLPRGVAIDQDPQLFSRYIIFKINAVQSKSQQMGSECRKSAYKERSGLDMVIYLCVRIRMT